MTYESDAVNATLLSRCLPCERGQHDRCELLQRPDAEGYVRAAECRCLHESREQHALKRSERARLLMLKGDWTGAGREWTALATIAKRAKAPITGAAAEATIHPRLRSVPSPAEPRTNKCSSTEGAEELELPAHLERTFDSENNYSTSTKGD